MSSTVLLVVRHFHFIHAQIMLLSGSPCTNNPCENGGTCSVVDGFASCACLNNWNGQTCTGNLIIMILTRDNIPFQEMVHCGKFDLTSNTHTQTCI